MNDLRLWWLPVMVTLHVSVTEKYRFLPVSLSLLFD